MYLFILHSHIKTIVINLKVKKISSIIRSKYKRDLQSEIYIRTKSIG